MNQDNFLSDKPIAEETEDKFQRYNFSKRIAETLIYRKSSDSIVIGLYGAWGEGKTSVLNFIKAELKKSADIIHFNFNPWRFTDESTLLINFFNTLALTLKREEKLVNEAKSKLKKALEKKEPLKTSAETIGEMIVKYAKALSPIGFDGTAESIGQLLSSVEIDDLKGRIEELLAKSNKKVVIIIDDIDRLEKKEIHAIFKLVKLTCDFSNTSYLLSFDEKIVSAAIGESFGDGDKSAGMDFLEKIIQIPLTLPLAQKDALLEFSLKTLEKSLNSINFEIEQDSIDEFVSKFTSNFLKRLVTPRLAVRYANRVSFSLPLLKGEVNYVDLLLIEAIHIFYPNVYDFIRAKPEFFIGDYSNDPYLSGQQNSKVEEFKKEFANLTKDSYREDEIPDLIAALKSLFPNLKMVWGNAWSFEEKISDVLYQEKRISDSRYFNRYFSYAVIKGDLSDVTFQEFLSSIKQKSIQDSVNDAQKILSDTTPERFLSKFRIEEKNYDEETSLILIKVFSQLGEHFSHNEYGIFGFATPLMQAVFFIVGLIRNNTEKVTQFRLIEDILKTVEPFKFAYQISNFSRKNNYQGEGMFTNDQYKALAKVLIDRAIELSKDKPIWEEFNFESKFLMNVWATDFDKSELQAYIFAALDKNIKSTILFLKVFVGYIHSSVQKEPYDGPFTEESYNWLKQVIEPKIIYEKVCDILHEPGLVVQHFDDLHNLQTNENLMKQFIFWYVRNNDQTTEIN